MRYRIGIDFGTSNSGAAYYDGDRVHVLPLDRKNVMPEVVKSILYITRDHRFTIGQEAVEQYYRQNVNRLRRYVKKWVGEIDYRGADMHYVRDIFTYVDELMPGRLLQYIKTALRSERYEGTQVFDRYYTLVEILAIYLGELKRRAEAELGDKIESVVLGRPVQFSPMQEVDQRAEAQLRQAAMLAGFQQVELELEPVAAACYYELSISRPQTALIFDFGGGTLDITIMRLGDPAGRQVFASGGIGIAGSDFDRAIIRNRMVPHFGWGRQELDADIRDLIEAVADWMVLPELSTPQVRAKLQAAILGGQAPVQLKALEMLIFNDLAFSFYNMVENAKIDLSAQDAVVLAMQNKHLDLWELYTRLQFEKDIREYQARIEGVLLDTLARSGFEAGEIDAVVTTGGSSSIPAFQRMLIRHFGKERLVASDVFSSVTAGLAVRASRA